MHETGRYLAGKRRRLSVCGGERSEGGWVEGEWGRKKEEKSAKIKRV